MKSLIQGDSEGMEDGSVEEVKGTEVVNYCKPTVFPRGMIQDLLTEVRQGGRLR